MAKERGNLVLTRRQGESLQLGRDITITVTKIKGGSVRLAIQAPQQIAIARSELHDEDTDIFEE